MLLKVLDAVFNVLSNRKGSHDVRTPDTWKPLITWKTTHPLVILVHLLIFLNHTL